MEVWIRRCMAGRATPTAPWGRQVLRSRRARRRRHQEQPVRGEVGPGEAKRSRSYPAIHSTSLLCFSVSEGHLHRVVAAVVLLWTLYQPCLRCLWCDVVCNTLMQCRGMFTWLQRHAPLRLPGEHSGVRPICCEPRGAETVPPLAPKGPHPRHLHRSLLQPCGT